MEREQRTHSLLGKLLAPRTSEAYEYVTDILAHEPSSDALSFMQTLKDKLQPNGKDIKACAWRDPACVRTIFNHLSQLSGRDGEEVYRKTRPYRFIDLKVFKTPGILEDLVRSTATSDLKFSHFIERNGPYPLDSVRFNITNGMLDYIRRIEIPHIPDIRTVSPFPYTKDGETYVGIGLLNGKGAAGGYIRTIETDIYASHWK